MFSESLSLRPPGVGGLVFMKVLRLMQAPFVQVWIASPADFAEAQWREFETLLDSLELARAQTFRLQQDRLAYVLAHALRRIALGEELNLMPAALAFSSEPGGRPTLIHPRCSGIGFSHAHTRQAVVFALWREGLLGVDIEAHCAMRGDLGLLSRFFTQPDGFESAASTCEPEAQSQAHFFFLWTALEAFWKARGTGLSTANPRVSFEASRAGVFRAVLPADASPAPALWVMPVAAPVGISISLAVQHPQPCVVTRRVTSLSFKGHGMSGQSHFFARPDRARVAVVQRATPI